MEKLLNTKQAADLLGVTEARIRQFIYDQRLPAQKIGRDHVIKQADFKDFQANGRKTTGRPKKSCVRDSI